jgi:hypothetical protein
MKAVRIVKTPPGEAPAHVRAAWIGVTLALADVGRAQPGVWATQGVLKKRYDLLGRVKRLLGILEEQPCPGYVVEVLPAIAALKARAPQAAVWWETKTPHLLRPGACFFFAEWCCEETIHEAS